MKTYFVTVAAILSTLTVWNTPNIYARCLDASLRSG